MSNANNGNNSRTTTNKTNGSNSNDVLSGDSVNEKVDAKAGDDTVTGGGGSDWVKGGSGNDRLVYIVGLNTGTTDLYDGGSGSNVLVLQMTRDEWMRDDIQADIAGYLAFLASTAPNAKGVNTSVGYEFTSLGLTARRIQSLEVTVDGVALDPRDESVVANNVYETTLTEHSIVTGNVTDNDEVPDLVREVTLVSGPSRGTLTLDSNGSYTYDPGMAFDSLAEGESAQVEFTYQVTDADRDSATATVVITITGTNDAPIVEGPLGVTVSEEDPVFVIDLLEGASDVDNGAVLNVSDFSVAGNKGGWILNGNLLTFDPDYYDDLNTGDLETLDFSYKIIDGLGGEVGQTLQVNVEGFTDAPSLAASASAGSAINQLKVKIASEPAKNETILLTFSNLPSEARVLNAAGLDVTAGVMDFIGIQDFIVEVPAGKTADFDFGMTVTGLNPDGSEIASTYGAIDFVYKHSNLSDQVTFRSEDQGIWAYGDAPTIQWHEYVPIIGGKARVWDSENKVWNDTGEGLWTSGEFSLLSIDVNAEEATSIALAGAQATLDDARQTFEVASVTVDQAVQNTYNAAVSAFNSAKTAALNAYNSASAAALKVFNEAINTISDVTEDAAIATYDAAVSAAAAVRQAAIDTFGWMGTWVTDTANDVYNATVSAALAVKNAVLAGAEAAADAVQQAAQQTYDAALSAAQWALDRANEVAQATFDAAKQVYDAAKQAVYDAAKAVFDTAQDAFNTVKSALETVQGSSKLEVNADLYGQVGVQVNFVLDSGSVDTEVQYDVSSILQHNRTTDTLMITPHLVNLTTGDAIAFETISPNASLKATLVYDVGARLNVLLDSNLVVGSNVIWDITPNSGPITLNPQVGTGGWGDELANLTPEQLASVSGSDQIDLQGFAEGEFVLIDLNSADIGQIRVPVESLTEDIVSLEVGIPTVQTQGKVADYDPSFFEEGGLIAVDISELTSTVMNLVNARLDFSPELKAEHPELGSLQDSESFSEAIAKVGEALLSTLFDSFDGQSKRTPILLLDANSQTNNSFLHLNAVPDSVIGDTLIEDTAKFGFFTAYGESNDLVKVTIDIDQAVAVIINKIVEAILGVVSAGATVTPLQALDDINPLDLSFGLEEILKLVEVPDATITEIKKYFDFNVGFEAADFDVYSAINFSQEFTLSVDDVVYLAIMEDGEQYEFAANTEGGLFIENASRHDANKDGFVDYQLTLTPKAMFSNDTEVGLTIGYVLDFLRASMKADLKLPLGDLLGISVLPTIPLNLANVNLGPLLRIQGDLDLASADIFESRFDINIGSDYIDGSYDAANEELITLVGVMPG